MFLLVLSCWMGQLQDKLSRSVEKGKNQRLNLRMMKVEKKKVRQWVKRTGYKRMLKYSVARVKKLIYERTKRWTSGHRPVSFEYVATGTKFYKDKLNKVIVKSGDSRAARVMMIKVKLAVLQRFGNCYPQAYGILRDYMNKGNSIDNLSKKYNTKKEVVKAILDLAIPKLNEFEDIELNSNVDS